MGVNGTVYLIGAGPGSADLITLRGRRALAAADVIVMDYLLPPSFLSDLGIATGQKEVIHLTPERHKQDDINRLIADAALAGKTVARLKGGDALVFGRGAEEAEFLTREGIEWEIVPGLTSGLAGASSADLAVTRRGGGRSFAIATARIAGGYAAGKLPTADSLILYMGVEVLADLCRDLIEQGWQPETPVAVIERASLPWEREVTGTLETVPSAAVDAGIAPPALLLIGAAASERIASRPTILFTGLDPTNFRRFGRLLHWPALQVAREDSGYALLPQVIAGLRAADFTHVIFTSKVGVDSLFQGIRDAGGDARYLARAIMVTAGAGTSQRLSEHGLVADLTPQDGGSDGIIRVLGDVAGKRILLVQGTHAPGGLEARLRSDSAEVTRLALHRIEPHPELGRPLPEHDIIYFISPSGVRAYADAYGAAAFQRRIWCIGEVTRRQVSALGFDSEVLDPAAIGAARE